MGQVWQAHDTQLNRDVALKMLPDAFAADPDRLARFKREAQILASLNHPNIAGIYGIEEAPSTSSGQASVLALETGQITRSAIWSLWLRTGQFARETCGRARGTLRRVRS